MLVRVGILQKRLLLLLRLHLHVLLHVQLALLLLLLLPQMALLLLSKMTRVETIGGCRRCWRGLCGR